MPVPKKHVSASKQNMRRAEDKLAVPHQVRKCPQCAEPMLQHHICPSCGFYRGKEVIEIPIE